MLKQIGCVLLLFTGSFFTLAQDKHLEKPKIPNPFKALPLKVEGDTQIVVRSFPCRIVAKEGSDFYVWYVPEAIKYEAEDNILIVKSAPNGTYKIRVTGVSTNFLVDKDGKLIIENGKVKKETIKDTGEIEIAIGSVTPIPPIPPGPIPPGPTPITDLPIKGEGFRMLIVEESANRTALPSSQRVFLTSKTVRDYLRAKCASDPSAGDGKAYRIIDPDMDLSTQPQFWKDAHKRAIEKASGKYPWIAVANGKEGYEGPLPDTLEKCVDILKRYGG